MNTTFGTNLKVAMELIGDQSRRDLIVDFYRNHLPQVAADLENLMSDQGARVNFQILIVEGTPKIQVTLHLKIDHEVLIHLDLPQSTFLVGSKRDGVPADTSEKAAQIVVQTLARLKA